MPQEYRFDDLDLREEPARFESDPDAAFSVTTNPRSDTCSVSCFTCFGGAE
jgi:hypothetical protein